jgi:LytS/YehU family sensor histidine kinase
MLITKLSGILRRLLRSTDHFVTLREELESIDEYLDIEVVRFGPQLKVDKQISPDTLDLIVPSMILQPLVENSIKHGFSARSAAAPSYPARRAARHRVEDDGMGSLQRLQEPMASGIGLANGAAPRVIHLRHLSAHAHDRARAPTPASETRADGRGTNHRMSLRRSWSSTTSSTRGKTYRS